MAPSPIVVSGVSKTFRVGLSKRVTAVDGIDFEVPAGSVVAFVGPNGAGKSTTLYMLLGLLRPDAGRISVLGYAPGHLESRRRLGFQSEIFNPYRFMTAAATLHMFGRLSGLSASVLDERVPATLRRFGLEEAGSRRVAGFSKGMTQRLGLAQAVLHQPDLLILDEPTTGLDPSGRKLVSEVVAEERARGATVLMSTHILGDVERLCDSVVMLHRGRVVLDEGMAQIRARAASLEDAYMAVVEAQT